MLPTPEPYNKCSILECDGNAHHSKLGRRGWCSRHYARWQRHGSPTSGGTPNGAPIAWLQDVALHHQSDECLDYKFGKIANGYGQVWIGGKKVYAHRWICEQFHGEPPTPEHEAAHSCGVRGCVNGKHLRWATTSENHADKVIHGTDGRGERCATAKLTRAQVREIRRRISSGETYVSIADDFPVGERAIGAIGRRNRWGWLDAPAPSDIATGEIGGRE